MPSKLSPSNWDTTPSPCWTLKSSTQLSSLPVLVLPTSADEPPNYLATLTKNIRVITPESSLLSTSTFNIYHLSTVGSSTAQRHSKSTHSSSPMLISTWPKLLWFMWIIFPQATFITVARMFFNKSIISSSCWKVSSGFPGYSEHSQPLPRTQENVLG